MAYKVAKKKQIFDKDHERGFHQQEWDEEDLKRVQKGR